MMYNPYSTYQPYQFGQRQQFQPTSQQPMLSTTRPPSSPFSGRVVAPREYEKVIERIRAI